MAFTVGSFFALPVMIDQAGAVGPSGAIKQSAEIVRKVWGESIVIILGMPIIAVIAGAIYTIIWGAVLVALTSSLQSTTNGHEVMAGAIIIGVLAFGYGIIIMIYSALSSIVTAALYLYATTAAAPAGFDPNLLAQIVRAKTGSDI